jgi:RNA polymerase sigma-70 factor (ECF subfamily)
MATAARDPVLDDAGPAAPLQAATVLVRRYLRFLGCDHDCVDDLAQDTLLAAVAAFGRGRPPLPWLLTTARNCLRMHLRRRGRRREVADLDRLHECWHEQVQDDGGEAQKEALRACLRALPGRARQVVELRYREGLGREAIAARLGIGSEGVKSLLARVRAALGECMRRRLDNEAR